MLDLRIERQICVEEQAVPLSRAKMEVSGPGIKPLVADPSTASDKGIARTLRVHLITQEVSLDLEPGRDLDRVNRSGTLHPVRRAHHKHGCPATARDLP